MDMWLTRRIRYRSIWFSLSNDHVLNCLVLVCDQLLVSLDNQLALWLGVQLHLHIVKICLWDTIILHKDSGTIGHKHHNRWWGINWPLQVQAQHHAAYLGRGVTAVSHHFTYYQSPYSIIFVYISSEPLLTSLPNWWRVDEQNTGMRKKELSGWTICTVKKESRHSRVSATSPV